MQPKPYVIGTAFITEYSQILGAAYVGTYVYYRPTLEAVVEGKEMKTLI